jgi:Flavin-binding monooxygenase-like
VNSQLLYELKHGRITPKPDIDRLEGRTVHFVDGSTIEADTIVWGTGFDVSFPFLDRDLFEWEGRYPKLAGLMPPGYANLYVWGLGQPRGGAGPLITAGARLLAKVVLTQREIDRPLANVLAKLRKPEARELFGVSEMMRQIKAGQRVMDVIRWSARRRNRRQGTPSRPEMPRAESGTDRVAEAPEPADEAADGPRALV